MDSQIKVEAFKDALLQFQSTISKMSLQVCCVTVLPELGVRWSEVRKAVRNARLPMTAASVGRILSKHLAKTASEEEVRELVAIMRIKLTAYSTSRVWHAIKLVQPVYEEFEDPSIWSSVVTSRIRKIAKKTLRDHSGYVEVHSSPINSYLFISITKVRYGGSTGVNLVVAASIGSDVAFVTSLANAPIIRIVARGLGYQKYIDAELHGKDITSLQRIMERDQNMEIDQLLPPEEYNPTPVITKNSIDYTNKTYNENYVQKLIGPNAPLLTDLNVQSEKVFFDPVRLNKSINVTMVIKSEDISKTLVSWVNAKAIPPTSEFISMFKTIKSNKYSC